MPYLGKDETRTKEDDVPAHVCLNLLEPYLKKGYNITTDNYFTSHNLADKLKQKQTTIVGTVRKQRREIPKVEDLMNMKALHSTEVFRSSSDCLLTVYKAKRSKNVYVLSSLHRSVSIDNQHSKMIPETVEFYNSTKYGVDIFDQMARYHSCKTGTRRWPMVVFFDIIDMAAINAWIIFCIISGESMPRRQFMLKLISELCRSSTDGPEVHLTTESPPIEENRKRRQCQYGCANKSTSGCEKCKKTCCGKHSAQKVTLITCQKCVH